MRQFFNSWHARMLSGLLVFGLAMPAAGQQRSEETGERGDRRAQQDRSQDARQSQERRQADRQERDRQMQLKPTGRITIGIDYDQDGRFEAVERIYAFDLAAARKQSQRRQQGSERERSSARDRSSLRDRSSREQRMISVEGELQDMQKIRMRDEDATYVVARVRTDQGRTAKVLLGQNEKLSKLDLSEGDRVQVEGRRGTINQQGILVASQVRSGDQRVEVQPKKRMKQERGEGKEQLRGSVIRTRTAEFRGHEGSFLVAEIRTRDGDRRLVNMGPEDKFDDVDFADAGDVLVVGQKGRVSGKEALIAERVYVDGEAIKVKPDEQRDQQWRKEREAQAGEREERQRETRERRFRDRETRERRFFDRGDREDREDRDRGGRFLNRRDSEDRDRERRLFDRQERERDGGILNRGDREDREREDGSARRGDR